MCIRDRAEIGKPKFSFPSMEVDHDLFEAIQNKYTEQVKFALDTDLSLIHI